MNHLGDTNKKGSETPRTDDHNWHDGDYDDPLHAFYDFACILERELNAANGRIELLMSANADVARIAGERDAAEKRIKRLEAELEQTKQDRNAIAKNTREPLLLQLDHANERIKRLEDYGNALVVHVYAYRTQRQWTEESYQDLIQTIADWDKAKATKP